MSAWRRKALEFLPEKSRLIQSAKSAGELWIELTLYFEKSVEENNSDITNRILRYLTWCTSEAAGDISNTTHQAVRCGFLECITHNKKHWPLFKSWFSRTQFENYKGSFYYTLQEKEYKSLEDIFYDR